MKLLSSETAKTETRSGIKSHMDENGNPSVVSKTIATKFHNQRRQWIDPSAPKQQLWQCKKIRRVHETVIATT